MVAGHRRRRPSASPAIGVADPRSSGGSVATRWSPPTFNPFFQEQSDGYDAVEWAAVQSWSNGRVGLTGTSYFGVTQWQAAVTTPPHLFAIAPGQTATDYHDHWTYMNG